MLPADVSIRPAERADLLAVLRIERACFTDPWPYEAFERFLGEPAFLVAERNGEVVGYAVADSTPNFGRDIGHLKDLAVRSDARGEGIGRGLLRAVLGSLHAQGATVVKLEVRESNEPARSLYDQAGFDSLRRLPNYYRDGEDALVLVIDLAEWTSGSGQP